MFWRRILAWLFFYLFATWVFSTILTILLLAAEILRFEIMDGLLFFWGVGVPMILMGVGVVSLLPLSEYAYLRQSGTNPPMAREGIRHQRKRRERRELGILLGIVGLTSVFGMSPSQIALFQSMSWLGRPATTALMTVMMVLFLTVYRKKVANEFDGNEEFVHD